MVAVYTLLHIWLTNYLVDAISAYLCHIAVRVDQRPFSRLSADDASRRPERVQEPPVVIDVNSVPLGSHSLPVTTATNVIGGALVHAADDDAGDSRHSEIVFINYFPDSVLHIEKSRTIPQFMFYMYSSSQKRSHVWHVRWQKHSNPKLKT